MAEDNGFAMGYALGQDSNGGGGNNGGWGGFGEGIWAVVIIALLFGRGGFGGGGLFGGGGNGNGGCGCGCCATQSDVRNAVDQQTLISKIDQQTYGLADTFTALNNTLNNNFRGIDNAVCTLGFQAQQGFSGLGAQLASCCCDIERGIERNTTQGIMNTNSIQQQIANCCCDLEKANMQNRFDAQAYNCNTLQAIDKLGDRIIGFMTNEKIDSLRAENQTLKFQASQVAQNNFITANQEAQTAELIRRLGRDVPVPAFVVPNPNCCYGSFGFGNGFGFNNGFGFGRDGCGCGCGCG